MINCSPICLTLAASGDWMEVVVYGIGTVIVVGSWIANQVRQLRAEQERRRKIAELEGRETPPTARRETGVSPVPTQAELARRRREQLAALSRRRGGQGAAAAGSGSRAEPANLSPADKTQRQRAQEAYERRARQLREQRAQQEHQQQAERDRYDRELAQRRERAEQSRRAREQQQQARRQAMRAGRPTQKSSVPSRQPTPPVRPVRRERPSDGRSAMTVARDARAVEAARRPAAPPVIAAAAIGKLDLAALRRAIVLKEVLDQPVALRDPLEGVPGLMQ